MNECGCVCDVYKFILINIGCTKATQRTNSTNNNENNEKEATVRSADNVYVWRRGKEMSIRLNECAHVFRMVVCVFVIRTWEFSTGGTIFFLLYFLN